MAEWFDQNLYFIYQIYGVAFLLLGLTALTTPRQIRLPFIDHIWLLGVFGLLHGLQEFVDAQRLIRESQTLVNLSSVLASSSFLALFEFGRRALSMPLRLSYLLAALPIGLMGLISGSLITTLGIGSRLTFGVFGALLTGIAFMRAKPYLEGSQDEALRVIWADVIAWAFLVYAALTLFSDATLMPAGLGLPSTQWFQQNTGLPVQVLRAICALVATIALCFKVFRANHKTAVDLETLMQSLNGFVYRCRNDRDWTLVYIAGNVEAVTGFDIKSIRKSETVSLNAGIHRDDQQRVADELRESLKHGAQFDLSYRIVTRQGESRWVSDRGHGIYDQKGQLIYFQGHVVDADELIQARLRLERAEELARLGHWEFDPATGTGIWSKQMFRMLGLPVEKDAAPDASTFLERIHPQDRDKTGKALQDMANGEAPTAEVFRSNPDFGPVHYFMPSWHFEGRGKYVRYSGTLLDVTRQQISMQQVQASEQAQRKALTLAQQEQGRMAALLSAMSIGILFEDRDGRVEYLNPAFRRMWAVSDKVNLIGEPTRRVLEHSTHRFARPDHASRHVLHVLDTHEISERFEVDLYDGRILTQLSYPVSDTDGRLIGRLWIYEDVTHERQTAQQLVYLAEHDPLTGLHNRHRFQEQLEWMILSARRNGTRFALLYFDLDDFKYINDTFGHRAGDNVLVRTAGEVASLVRQGEMFARLGGDEFAILTELHDKDHPEPLAERICHAIAAIPFRFRGSNLRLTTSVGITIFPQHGDNAEDLVAHADTAMYQAKNAGKNSWAIYDANKDATEAMITRMNWVSRIAHALESNLLELHFQGVYQTIDRSLSHLEALVRMRDPAQPDELIMPGQFIPIAEKSGQILEIDRWVLRNSIALLANHPELNALSVNISGRSFDEPGLPQTIQQLLHEYNVAPQRLLIELTETAAVSEMQDAQRFIEALQQTGCIVCLDDFGTGFSTFAYLKYLGVEILKIDGMFIRDLPNNRDNQAFVKAMVDVGKGLNKITVAEFVEDRETFEMLQKLGIDLAQGYFLDRPDADHPALHKPLD
ncbi:sensor domain-containing protein [Pseudohongiella spirulinae]|uniref:Diguanylate cyclase n=1 Tax=Pseudohongiella spirulinae TaxID=1249552 RepID=A0A0S2KGH9_9GAMM|nr:EAL domain-containing protein [Pseudohongiella spirulinae]ALO47214.1 diguanylate cyclase [Pseudohongiella spirulinae]